MKRAHKRTLAQADSCTPENVGPFFRLLQQQILEHNLTADRIYNMDETGVDRLAASAAPVAIAVGEMTPQPSAQTSAACQHCYMHWRGRHDGSADVHLQGRHELAAALACDGRLRAGSQFTQTGDPRMFCL
jgi:hypothetical protein